MHIKLILKQIHKLADSSISDFNSPYAKSTHWKKQLVKLINT